MRNFILLLVILFSSKIMAVDDSTNIKLYDRSAIVLSNYTFKYSLFTDAEYKVNEKISILGHPLMFFLSPSLQLKYNFYNKNNLYISSIHGLNYPTLLLRLVKGKGTGGFISPEFNIPHIFSINNSIIASVILKKNHFITGSIGMEFALNNSNLEPGTSIDLPFILPRTMVYYKNIGFNFNIIAEGKLFEDFDYHLKNEFFLFPVNDDDYDYEYQKTSNSFFWEQTGNIFWNIMNTFKLGVGGKLSYGTYPFGTQWHLIPFIDFVKYIE